MRLWEKHKEGSLRCTLCPKLCIIRPGGRGICGARENREGEIYPITAGIISGYTFSRIIRM